MRKTILILIIFICIFSVFLSPAFAVTFLPNPTTIVDGLPVAIPYDDFISYSTQLLTAFGFSGFNGPAGVGGLDIVLLTQANGIKNNPVNGGLVFEDPADSVSGNCPGCDTFSGTWGAGLQPNGPVTVDKLLTYLHNQFGPTANIPVFTFDMVEPNNTDKDLNLVANFTIFDTIANSEVASWSLDAINNGVFDPAAFITVQGEIILTGTSLATYEAHNTGSGQYDFLVIAPTMDLSPYNNPRYQFRIFSEFRNIQGGGEESFISGGFTTLPPPALVPEPSSFLFLSLGLLGIRLRRNLFQK